MGDKVTRKVGGEVWSGEVVTVNMNLLEIEWEGSSNRQWVNEDLVDTETSVSQVGLEEALYRRLYIGCADIQDYRRLCIGFPVQEALYKSTFTLQISGDVNPDSIQ